jgi:hypothetical protein
MTSTITSEACRSIRWVGLLGLLVAAAGCERSAPTTLVAQPMPVPVPVTSVVPQLSTTSTGDLLLSWLEPRSGNGYRFRVATRHGDTWTDPITIDDSQDVSSFGADLPGVAESPDGTWLAYWERHDPRAIDDVYATDIHLARSTDRGRTWTPLASPHHDDVSGQHSFMSAFVADRELGLVWLDAQQQHRVHTPAAAATPEKDEYLGAVGLRYASFGPEGRQTADTFIDPITCECCPTAAAVTARGPVVAYRDRVTPSGARPVDIRYETATVRDISLVRLENGRWTEPRRVHADNWTINLCPDNGPAVDAIGHRLAVAWWTAADDRPHVSVAFSDDAGDTFGAPIRADVKAADGQVTVAAVDQGRGAVVGWLEDHQTWARWIGADGRLGPPLSLGSAPNHARLPRWIAVNDGVLAVWNDETRGQRSVHMARLVRK